MSMTDAENERAGVGPAITRSVLSPLEYFYTALGMPLPPVTQVGPADLPASAKGLLVHDRDMTPTLESAYGSKLHLRILRSVVEQETVHRLVALRLESDKRAVAMGAIHIFLARLPAAAQERILEWRDPFGRILIESGVTHCSRPVAFFSVTPDSMMMEALGMRETCRLYGRRNTIWNGAGQELANVVEILPPSENVDQEKVS